MTEKIPASCVSRGDLVVSGNALANIDGKSASSLVSSSDGLASADVALGDALPRPRHFQLVVQVWPHRLAGVENVLADLDDQVVWEGL